MAGKTEILTGTIDDFLLSIASGLRRAQAELNRMVDGSGAAPIVYTIPTLDFELVTTIQLTNSPAVANKYSGIMPPTTSSNAMHVLMQSIAPSSSAGSSIEEQSRSRISGTFKAVPANAGRPDVVLQTLVTREEARRLTVSVSIVSVLGEAITGEEVHFNIDKNQSGVTSPDTRFLPGVVTTSDGKAASTLTIDDTETTGAPIMIVVDAVGQTETIAHEV